MPLPLMTDTQKALLAKIGLTPEQFEERILQMQAQRLGPALDLLKKRPRSAHKTESELFDSNVFRKKR